MGKENEPELVPRGIPYKSNDCRACPEYEKAKMLLVGFLSLLSSPALKALLRYGVETDEQLAQYPEHEILALYGIGKASLPILKQVLTQAN